MKVHIKIISRTASVASQKTSFVGLVNRLLQNHSLVEKFASNVDIRSTSTHSKTSDKATLYQRMWIFSHDFTILTRSGFRLVRVHDQEIRTSVAFLGHERP